MIRRVVSEDRDALKDILDHEITADVAHATHDTWEGGEQSARWNTDDDQKSVEQGNLVQPIDHSKAAGSEPVTREIEVIDHSTGEVVVVSDRLDGISESRFRVLVRNILSRL